MSEFSVLPTCVGFIMDGNRRWATEQELPTVNGHEKGAEVFFAVVDWVREYHIPHAVFYAFSTENWKRSETEVAYLMNLFSHALGDIHAVRVKIIGERELFSPELQTKMRDLESKSETVESETTIWVALSYGGRAEITAAVNEAVRLGAPVTSDSFGQLLWTTGMPDPDLIIRTGGDMRLSNFLPWQTVYSELMFTNTYWPAFTKEEFTRMLTQYGERKRRFGA